MSRLLAMSKYFSAGLRKATSSATEIINRKGHLILLHIVETFYRFYQSFLDLRRRQNVFDTINIRNEQFVLCRKAFLIQAVGFADTTLDEVAVDGPFEVSF